eukprot:TRINITY_DN3267_c0_g2_i1.p1 TRINITY_DN3267_c0_g2~~TRINITY_DN3267_c0_g2_i1.p1  ORF type:complete len:268 (+),score=62.70 TRINITY_DN3267_c0_g2_i1:67-870(+)
MNEIDPPLDRLTLNSTLSLGFYTGLLKKQGGIVKSWKERYFSLSWAGLSYYELNLKFIHNIPMEQCTRVENSTSDELGLNLVTRDRTFYFVAPTKQDKTNWMNALGAVIAVQDSNVVNYPYYVSVKKVAYHVLRIKKGARLLLETNPVLRDLANNMSFAMFGVFRAYAGALGGHSDLEKKMKSKELEEKYETLKQNVLILKKNIPPEHRMWDEQGFDIAAEQREINIALANLCRKEVVSGQELNFENLEDIKPFILDTLSFALQHGQ